MTHTLVWEILHRDFADRWIRHEETVPWTLRSPNLTPFDYFLWDSIKDRVHRDIPTTPEDYVAKDNTCMFGNYGTFVIKCPWFM